MSRTANFAKKFLAENRVVVEFIYDDNGFRRGVVVAINKDQIGWSLVSDEDYTLYKGRIADIPGIKRLLAEAVLAPADALEAIFKLPVFTRIERGYRPKMPAFDKNLGFAIAIRRALADKGQTRELPMNEAAVKAIENVLEKAKTWF
jgi:hypothetical protein